jgi:hypothetical protein
LAKAQEEEIRAKNKSKETQEPPQSTEAALFMYLWIFRGEGRWMPIRLVSNQKRKLKTISLAQVVRGRMPGVWNLNPSHRTKKRGIPTFTIMKNLNLGGILLDPKVA